MNVLSQREIDELIKAMENDTLQEWLTFHKELEKDEEDKSNDGCKYKINRFMINEVYEVEDYDLFYVNFALEKLTKNCSILRRYAYKDNQSFRKYQYFIVLEDYISKNMNAVSVVGVSTSVLNKSDYHYIIEQELIFLVDASSLSYFCDVFIR